MDTEQLRDIVKQTLNQLAQLRPSHGDIRVDVLFDEAHDRYALMQVGWNRNQRVRGNLLYLILKDNKVVIEYDGVGYGIEPNLIDRGIPKEQIVFAFLSPPALSSAV